MRQRASETESGFILTVKNSHFKPRFSAHSPHEYFAILGVAHCTRGDDLSVFHTELAGERRHSAQRAEGILNCYLTQHSTLTKTGAQSRRGLHFVDDPDRSGGRHVRDRLSNRIRSDVDCGDANVRVAPLRRSARAQSQMWFGGCSHDALPAPGETLFSVTFSSAGIPNSAVGVDECVTILTGAEYQLEDSEASVNLSR